MNRHFGLNSTVNLGDAAQAKDNNFRVIRHLAAGSVIYSHAFIVNWGYEAVANEPLYVVFGIPVGDIAVDIFFIVSGFLVTHSLVSRGDLADFFLSRFLRIYPALFIVAVISAFILGPIVSELPFSEYFSRRAVYGFAFWDTLMATPKHFRYELPGVFSSLPYPNVINGSLWSLAWELWMYWILVVLYIGGLIFRPLFWAAPIYGVYVSIQFGLLDFSSFGHLLFRLLAFFYAGALMSIYRNRILLSPALLLAATVLVIAGTLSFRNAFLLPPFLAYAVIFLAHYPKVVATRLSHGDDISYGLYIYAYPIQQMLVWQFGPRNPYIHSVVALALTIPIAYLSWSLIESPCIALKQRIRLRHHSPLN